MRITKQLTSADTILDTASHAVNFSVITPTNVTSVQKRFLAGAVINPVFRYKEIEKNLLHHRREVSAITFSKQGPLQTILQEKREEMLQKIDLLASVGCDDFTKRSHDLYGLPKKRLVDAAYEIAQKEVTLDKTPKVKAKPAIKLLKDNLKKFNLKYKVQRRDIITSAVVEAGHQRIILKKKERFSQNFLNRLVVHEIGAHVFRYENAKVQPLKIFRHGLAHYLETEEGLAVMNEERFGQLRDVYLKNYAGRVIAINTAKEKNFYHTFRELKRYFDKKKAFRLAMRVKRGLTYTDVPGGYTKDFVYLRGYREVKKYLKKGNIKDLYVGKVGLQHLELLKKVKLKEPKLLPTEFKLLGQEENKKK